MINATMLCLAILAGNQEGLTHLSPKKLDFACGNAQNLVQMSENYGIKPTTLAALVYIESGWNHKAISHANACGLTQVLPKYVKWSCKELMNPVVSFEAGAFSLSKWLKHVDKKKLTKNQKKDKEKIALACYNAGYICNKSKYARRYSDKVRKISIFYEYFLKIQTGDTKCQNGNKEQ